MTKRVVETGWPIDNCDLCGDKIKKQNALVANTIQLAGDVLTILLPLSRCIHCGTFMVGISPSQMERHLLVPGYNHPRGYTAHCQKRERFFLWIISRYLNNLRHASETKILDFGSGLGHMVKILSDSGFNATGVEISDRARRFASKHAPNARFVRDLKSLADEKVSFDAILTIDSLYSVTSPREEILLMSNLLKPGGLLIVRYTNRNWYYYYKRLFAKILLPSPFGDARWGFSFKGLKYLLSNCGMEISQVDYLERGKDEGFQKNLYYLISGIVSTVSYGLVCISPGIIICAIKKKAY